ncbi:hypothetical protein [Ancylobacter radicis]|uniref:DUF4258 domain-containing protein n=1 Tax=Ancylobacter radicis TaxID=2836179 RepID=A0ABS5R1U7_9HYPH|nr:hypothetical protein [Ancylobacter radicis]MBS9475629.1 hypothetical protein [Ancylobacter radicis]
MSVSVEIAPHARESAQERGATEVEIVETVVSGESFPAKFGRVGFRRNHPFNSHWRGQFYTTKQIEVFAVEEHGRWIVVTVLVKFFGKAAP